jgi:hypothetical protein
MKFDRKMDEPKTGYDEAQGKAYYYRLGRLAAKRHRERSCCPFPPGSFNYEAWQQGYESLRRYVYDEDDD